MATHPAFLPGEFHGERSLVGYNPQGRKESDRTERLTLITINILVYLLKVFCVCMCITTVKYAIHNFKSLVLLFA